MAALTCIVLSFAAHAGDGSAINVVGFSPDGRYFAFEQFGERSGDGQLFAEVYTIDVRDDRYAEAPIVERWQPETEDRRRKPVRFTLDQVRQKAAAAAAPTLKRLGVTAKAALIAEQPAARIGDVLGQIHVAPVREAATEALAVSGAALGGKARLLLRDLPMDVKRCANRVLEGKPKGMALTLEREKHPPQTILHDRRIPNARGCPDRYGLAAVHALPRADGTVAVAVLIQYFYYAFEGHDRRFFAVTAAVR